MPRTIAGKFAGLAAAAANVLRHHHPTRGRRVPLSGATHTHDHRAALVRNGTRRVYCAYDADPAGDAAAEQLACDLAGHGIEVYRVVLPCKDVNDFLVGGGTRERFQALLDAAEPIRTASAGSSAAVAGDALAPASPPPATAFPLEVTLGERTYTIDEPPTGERARPRFERPHQPNLTGTPEAYHPPGSVLGEGRRAKATGDYEPWRPG